MLYGRGKGAFDGSRLLSMGSFEDPHGAGPRSWTFTEGISIVTNESEEIILLADFGYTDIVAGSYN